MTNKNKAATARKTSKNDPLRVDFLSADALGLPGRIGLTIAPGKKDADRNWDRDLAADLDRLRAHYKADLLVSLMEKFEYGMLGIEDLLPRAEAVGIETAWFPIRDVDAPPATAMVKYQQLIERILVAARAGKTVVIHCRGGVGRSGTVAASCLVAVGCDGKQAIELVRAARPGAVEVPSQEQWVEKFATARSKVEKKRVSARQKPTPRNAAKPTVDRFLGCLLGGAMGDALGYPVEFIDSAAIQRKHGSSAPARLNYAGGKVAVVSDDTQMTLFTAEGLIRAQQRMTERGNPIAVIGRALLRWYSTQRGGGVAKDKWPGWLVAEPRLHAGRAPGSTCMGALGKIAAGGAFPDLASLPNDSKGCGAVMRAAPIGLGVSSREIAFEFGRDSGVLTHGHPSGYLSAAYFAAVIWDLARGADLRSAMSNADRLLAGEKGNGEMVEILARTRALATKGPPTVIAIESLGGGWTGEQALAIALLCALTHEADGADGVKRTLWTAAAHSGDSDSTAAITGNLLGAVCGAGGLPQDWLGQLEMRDVLERIAKDMHRRLIEDEALDEVAYPPN